MVNIIFVKVLFRTIANTHVPIKIYREFYHSIIYIANKGCHVKIKK